MLENRSDEHHNESKLKNLCTENMLRHTFMSCCVSEETHTGQHLPLFFLMLALSYLNTSVLKTVTKSKALSFASLYIWLLW